MSFASFSRMFMTFGLLSLGLVPARAASIFPPLAKRPGHRVAIRESVMCQASCCSSLLLLLSVPEAGILGSQASSFSSLSSPSLRAAWGLNPLVRHKCFYSFHFHYFNDSLHKPCQMGLSPVYQRSSER